MDYRHHLLSAVATSLVSFLLSLPAQAQQQPRYSNTGSVLIVDVRVIDGLGNEPVEGRDILVVDGMIAAIGESGSLEALDDVRTIDGTGMTAMPGLIDLHIHTQGGWANGLIPGNAYQVTYDDASVQQRLSGDLMDMTC